MSAFLCCCVNLKNQGLSPSPFPAAYLRRKDNNKSWVCFGIIQEYISVAEKNHLRFFSGLRLFRASVAAQQCLLKEQVSRSAVLSFACQIATSWMQDGCCSSSQIRLLGRRNSRRTSCVYPLLFFDSHRTLSLTFDKLITHLWLQFNHDLTELDYRFSSSSVKKFLTSWANKCYSIMNVG